jgi:hypothetical protein
MPARNTGHRDTEIRTGRMRSADLGLTAPLILGLRIAVQLVIGAEDEHLAGVLDPVGETRRDGARAAWWSPQANRLRRIVRTLCSGGRSSGSAVPIS